MCFGHHPCCHSSPVLTDTTSNNNQRRFRRLWHVWTTPSPSRPRGERRENRSLPPNNHLDVWAELIKPVLDVGSGPLNPRHFRRNRKSSSWSTLVSRSWTSGTSDLATSPRALLRNVSVPSNVLSKQARGYEAFTRRFHIPFMCECCGAQMHNA